MKIDLWHTSATIITDINIHHGRKNADMGQGFYTAIEKEFALLWSREWFYINHYELETNDLRVIELKQDINWFKTIYDNRNNMNDHYPDVDIIIAPIANDTIFDLVGLLTSGFLNDELSLKILTQGPKYHQVVIKSNKAKEKLRFIDAQQVNKSEVETFKKKAAIIEEDFLTKAKECLGEYKELLEE